MCLSYNTYSQEIQSPIIDLKTDNSEDWTVYVTNENFEVQYKIEHCDPSIGYDNQSVLLKLTNKTTDKLVFNWFHTLSYDGNCLTCDYPEEYTFEISVPSGSSIEGDCTVYSDYRLKIFSKFDDPNYKKGGKTLTSFQLKNLKATSH